MLIIFDLDDTLIDTRNSIVPFQLKKIFDAILSSEKSGFQNFLSFCLEKKHTKEGIKLYLENNNQKHCLQVCLDLLEKDLTGVGVQTFPRVKTVLRQIKKFSSLFLVTYGKKSFQLEKLKKAGIDSDLFSKIIVTRKKNKKMAYKQILKTYSHKRDPVFVCGDRDTDLIPAKELGLLTVHAKMGRGAKENNEKYADYTIRHIEEILTILQVFK